jgi:uncharacterized membrane protein YbhN (UPF0104 family)
MKYFLYASKYIVSAVIIFFLFKNNYLDFSIFKENKGMGFYSLFAIFVLLNFLFFCSRWFFLLRPLFQIQYKKILIISWIGSFFQFFLPSSLSSDFVKGYYLFKDPETRNTSLLTLLFDRIFAMGMLVSISFISCLIIYFKYGFFPAYSSLIGILFFSSLLGFCLFLYLPTNLLSKISIFRGLESLRRAYRLNYRYLGYAVGSNLLAHGFLLAIFFLGYDIDTDYFYYVMLVVPISFLFSALPISLGGIGMVQLGAVLMSQSYNQDWSSRLVTTFTVLQSMQFLLSLFGYVLYLRMKKDFRLTDA